MLQYPLSFIYIFLVHARYHCNREAAISEFHACSHVAKTLTAVGDQFPCVCLNTAKEHCSLTAHLASFPFEFSAVTSSAFAHMFTLANLIIDTCLRQVMGRRTLNMMNARYSSSGFSLSLTFAFFGHYGFHVILLTAFKNIPL